MRLFALVFGLFWSLSYGFAQTSPKSTDSTAGSKNLIIRDFVWSKNSNPLIVIDGMEFAGSLGYKAMGNLDTAKILDVKVLKGDSAKDIYGEYGKNGVILITTRTYAQNQLDMLLTRLSKSYTAYRQAHKDDRDFVYVLNGKQITGRDEEILRSLFKSSSKIKHASLIDAYKFSVPKTVVVMITDE